MTHYSTWRGHNPERVATIVLMDTREDVETWSTRHAHPIYDTNGQRIQSTREVARSQQPRTAVVGAPVGQGVGSVGGFQQIVQPTQPAWASGIGGIGASGRSGAHTMLLPDAAIYSRF